MCSVPVCQILAVGENLDFGPTDDFIEMFEALRDL